MSQNLPPQSDFPLTLAEVLYGELKNAGVTTASANSLTFKKVKEGIEKFPGVAQRQLFDRREIIAPNLLAKKLLDRDESVPKDLLELLNDEERGNLERLSQADNDKGTRQQLEQSL